MLGCSNFIQAYQKLQKFDATPVESSYWEDDEGGWGYDRYDRYDITFEYSKGIRYAAIDMIVDSKTLSEEQKVAILRGEGYDGYTSPDMRIKAEEGLEKLAKSGSEKAMECIIEDYKRGALSYEGVKGYWNVAAAGTVLHRLGRQDILQLWESEIQRKYEEKRERDRRREEFEDRKWG